MSKETLDPQLHVYFFGSLKLQEAVNSNIE